MRILLAPMEGLLDFMLRDALTQSGTVARDARSTIEHCGIDLCISEFIRVTNSLLPASNFYRVVPELKNQSRTPAGVPVRLQLLGSDPVCMAENAAKAASLGAAGIDINFGCPAKIVNRHRGGAALLKEPELMREIVAAIRAAVPASVSVTAKMRLGYEVPDYAVECAQALQDGGADEITVHARTKTDGYKPPAYWEWIAQIREALQIPVIANGEIWTAADARRCREISGCTDIMIGRGAVANPALALMIRGELESPLPWSEVIVLLHRYWATVSRHISERHRNGRIKQWLLYLGRTYPEAEALFDAIRRVIAPAEIEQLVFPHLLREVA
ncbi:tRNA-dihydrouridine synthase C, putative [Ricinus communis]|uniref:tRNA-dihydrouridine synthase n=1 Tax=Ricinus communis TaxID=3988 RepID=B9TGM1_RICCO|nr:tRNA-dihydrouridine synthase C, putative [Ricinus communis]